MHGAARGAFAVPAGDSFEVGVTPPLALSQIGNLLVCVGRHNNVTQLCLKAVSAGQPRALAGTTEGAE